MLTRIAPLLLLFFSIGYQTMADTTTLTIRAKAKDAAGEGECGTRWGVGTVLGGQ